MKSLAAIGLKDVQTVYGGPEGDLWELVMGQQIHIGGFRSSMALAEAAGLRAGTSGVDLCCCTGAGMRFLVRFRQVARMHGVDATQAVIRRGAQRCRDEGMADRIHFTLADVCQTGLASASADFVWGEDAWCYVADKPALIAEAARLVKPGGTIAFTDWVECPGLTDAEAERYLRFMKFPNILRLEEYTEFLVANGCQPVLAEDTRMMAAHFDLYVKMLDMQLTYDAAKIIGFDMNLMGRLAYEMQFLASLASDGKIAQGRFVARKRGN